MKFTVSILLIVLVLMIFTSSWAVDGQRLNLKSQTISDRLAAVEVARKSLDLEMIRLEKQMDFIFAEYGEDPARMNDVTLNELIRVQTHYAVGKQFIVENLKKVYLPSYQSKQIPVEKLLNQAIYNASKDCRLFDKLASKCLDEREILVFQVHYLKLQIEGLNTTEASVLSQINTLLREENNLYL